MKLKADMVFTDPPYGLPPHGGSGLKYIIASLNIVVWMSPSTRREWIEIYNINLHIVKIAVSPSTRREWIEIPLYIPIVHPRSVSLHTEGVD